MITFESFKKKKEMKVIAKKEMKRFPVNAVSVLTQLDIEETLIKEVAFSVK